MKRAQSSQQKGPGSAELVNSLSISLAKCLVAKELKTWSEERDGCTVSTRVTQKGEYPRVGIKTHLGEQFAHLPKQQCRVLITHLILRANGQTVPSWESGSDVAHSCHNGKAKHDGYKCCITLGHLSVTTHDANMKQQNCPALTRCSFCQLLSRCPHSCLAAHALELEFKSQKKVASVTLTYEDGSSVVILK